MFKSVGRFFKKVGRGLKKHWKKVLVIGAIAAAAFFTFGASLGLTAVGSWGQAVSGFMAKIGLQGTLANVLGGAITQAGYGAVVGGAVGAATGQGFFKGATTGLVTGLATGGVSGALGIGPGLQAKPAGATPAAGAFPGAGGTPGAAAGAALDAGASAGASAGAGASGMGGTLLKGAKGLGKYLKESGSIGPLIKGIGQGIAGDAQYDAMMARDQGLRDSYDLDWGNLGFAGGPSGSYAETRPAEASTQRPEAPAPAALAKSNTLTDTSERILRGM